MVRPDDITQFMDNRWFDSLAGVGSWAVNILGSLLALFILWLVWSYLEHKIKVTVFPIYGAEAEQLKDVKALKDLKGSKIILGQPFKRKGKDIKDKGIRKFSLMQKNFFIKKKLEEVPYEMRYPDGVWFIQPSKDKYIPIQRPNITKEDEIKISVPDTGMDLWQQAAEADLRRRTQDEDTLKRQMYMTVGIIIGAFVLAGIIIWLSMSFAGKSIGDVLTKVEPMTQALQNLAQNKGPG